MHKERKTLADTKLHSYNSTFHYNCYKHFSGEVSNP